MATETLLVKTKDNRVVVFTLNYENEAEKAAQKNQCENFCRDKDYSELTGLNFNISGVECDNENTQFLYNEVSGYHHRRERDEYKNNVTSPYADNPAGFPEMTVDDSFVPGVIKALGFKIRSNDKTYTVSYNETEEKYVINPELNTSNAEVIMGFKEITVWRNKYNFSPEDKTKLEEMIAEFKRQLADNPQLTISDYAHTISDSKYRKLFNIYKREYETWEHMDKTIGHEFKHIANTIYKDGLSLHKDVKSLSVEDCYRLAAEDERSAFFGQIINSLNEYLQKGDYSDYSMFDRDGRTFVNDLKALPNDEARKQYATDYPALLHKLLDDFKINHQQHYEDNQFENTASDISKSQPLTAPEDTDHEWFKRLRKLYYHYQVYNPDTKRLENMYFADYIDAAHEVELREDIIDRLKAERTTRKDSLQEQINNGNIDISLVEPARRLMRDALSSSQFINSVERLNVSSLLEDDLSSPRPSAPHDHANWSDALQQYWSQQTGYQEVAKNNDEYSFKINDHAVRYTAPNKVNLSPTADYDLYEKLLQEPSNKDRPVEFMPSLSPEQALMLYVACINCGRQPVGANVPQDLSLINNLRGITPQALNRFNAARGQNDQRGENNRNGENGESRADTSSENNQQTEAENMQHIAHVRERIENNAGHNRHKQPTATPPTGRRAPLNPIMARMLASRARKM